MDIRGLGYVIIESTDIALWQHFGTQVMGLMVAPGMPEDGNLYLKMDEYPYRFMIVPSDRDRFSVPGWEVAISRFSLRSCTGAACSSSSHAII